MIRSDEFHRLHLYLVTDNRHDERSLLDAVKDAIAGGVTAIQLRRKEALGRDFVQLGHEVRRLTREKGVLFFVNDRVDVAKLVEADGVHVGQDDISCVDARRLLGPDRWIGVSVDTVQEAHAAERDGADYVGAGAVFLTSTKVDAGFTGLEGLEAICRSVRIPVVGIGGIQVHTAREVITHGAAGVAVVSAILSQPSPLQAARDFIQAMK